MLEIYLYDFLKMFDGSLPIAVYINDEEEPIYIGNLWDLPWWLIDLKLNYDTEDHYPVSYRQNFEDDKPGLVIFVKEE